LLTVSAAALLWILVPTIPGPPTTTAGTTHDQPAQSSAERLETVSDLPRKARLALFNAQGKRNEGDFSAAAAILNDFLAQQPDQDHFLVRYHLAHSLHQAGRPDEAVTHYQAAVRLENRFAQGWLNLGELAYELGQFDLAAEALVNGFEHSPSSPPKVLYYAAVAHLQDGNPTRAAPLLEDLVSGTWGEPELDWFRALISACIELEDPRRGQRAVAGMLQSYDTNPEAWYLAFQFAAASGDYRQATVALTVTSYLRPLTRSELLQLGDLYSAVGVPAQACGYYEQALAQGGTTPEFERLASAYLASYDSEAALQTLTQAIEKEPSVRLWSLLGDLYYMEKDYEKSYQAFEQCTVLDAKQGRAYLMMGYCALELGRKEDALAQLVRAATFTEYEERAGQLLERVQQM
jgi:tetratricopeptide (TPR) repeat protein